MLKTFTVYFAILWSFAEISGMPQDIQQGAMMAAAQAKEAFDNGAAARHDKSIEIMGAKFKAGMEVGFGDAVKHKRSTADGNDDDSSIDDYSYSDYSDYEVTEKRRKRSIIFKNIW